MNLENQVTSLELSKRLQELGVKQDSLFYWIPSFNNYILTSSFVDDLSDYDCNLYLETIKKTIPEKIYSAFTVADLGEMLPDWSESVKRTEKDWVCIVRNQHNDVNNHSFAETEANARAKMLIYLLENDFTHAQY